MKYLLFLLVAVTVALASGDGCNETGIGSVYPGSDAVSLTVVNDWTQTHQVLGLDAVGDLILASYNDDGKLQFYNRATGVPATTMPLSSSNTGCFGVAWDNNLTTPVYHTSDWFSANMFRTEDSGTTWTSLTAPNGSNARGMDFDGTDYWCTNGDGGGLWKFQPGGAQVNLATPEIPSQSSGLAVFPYEGDLGIVVTTYSTYNFYFYRWDGTNMVYLGTEPCPVAGIVSSYGLAYSDVNQHLYWSYKDSAGAFHLCEISFDVTSLARSSWGAIKASF